MIESLAGLASPRISGEMTLWFSFFRRKRKVFQSGERLKNLLRRTTANDYAGVPRAGCSTELSSRTGFGEIIIWS
jgi:hypothetical protein